MRVVSQINTYFEAIYFIVIKCLIEPSLLTYLEAIDDFVNYKTLKLHICEVNKYFFDLKISGSPSIKQIKCI